MTGHAHQGDAAQAKGGMLHLGDATPEEIRRIVEALYHVHRLIAVITDLDTLLVRITQESKSVAGAEASSLILYDAASDELYFQVALGEAGDQEALKRDIRLKMGQGIAGATAQTRRSIIVDNAQDDPRFFRDVDAAIGFQTRNLLAVPMLDRDRLVGVLEVVNKVDGSSFTDRDMRVMEMFSGLAATSITNARLIEEHIRNERLAAIGQAVTGLSHYTKNIVTGLTSSADLIDMGLESENLDVLRRAWPVFKRSTKRISNFVQDMLSFSKPQKPMRAPCRIEEIIEEACETFGELFTRQKIALAVDTSGVTTPIEADAQALYRCLLNLLMNAAEAVPAEGGRIDVSAAVLPTGTLEVRVEDNGQGIAAKDLQRIFDPFFSTKGSKGTGLGLAVTRKIVDEHGGSIRVSSILNRGAQFRIVLPVKAPEKLE